VDAKQQAESAGNAVGAAVNAAPNIAQASKFFAQAQKISQGQPVPGNAQTGVV
jgi:hypothetical protein